MALRARHVTASAFVLGALVFGCQMIVSSDVPDFACASTDPSACPRGLTCDLGLGKCVVAPDTTDGSDEADADSSVTPIADASVDREAGPSALGVACRIDSDCESGLCGTNAMLSPAITQGTGPFCTQTCCTSQDCKPGFVCFGPGTGGNYCVASAKLGLSPRTNSALAGASCTADGDCRSGNCENNRCLDTCCSSANCAAGTTCRIVAVNATTPAHEVWACAAPPGPKDAGATCLDNAECSSNACVPTGSGACRIPCCGRASCAAAGFANQRCTYGPSNNDVYKLCFGSGGVKTVGSTCQTDNECASLYCDAELKQCAETCCVDADCPTKQVCRPSAIQTPFLRCVPQPAR